MAALHVLVAAADDALADEVRAALADASEVTAQLHVSTDRREAVAWARDRQPDLIVLGMEGGVPELESAAAALSAAAPAARLLAAYRPAELPDAESMIPVLRAQVRDFVRRPVSSVELRAVLHRLLDPATSGLSAGRLVSFVSNKGGIGKSTVSVNTAVALARHRPGRVLLVDASLQLGVASSLLGLEPETTLADAARQLDRLDGRLLRTLTVEHESGLRLLAAPRDALDASVVGDQAMGRILSLARRSFDLVVVDTFPMVDSVAVAILDLSDRIHMVLGSQVPYVLGAEAFVRVLGQLGLPDERLRLVLNETHPRFPGRLRPQDVADRLGRTLDHVVPYHRSALTAVNTGRPAVLGLGRLNRFGRAIRRLAADIETLLEPGGGPALADQPGANGAAEGLRAQEPSP